MTRSTRPIVLGLTLFALGLGIGPTGWTQETGRDTSEQEAPSVPSEGAPTTELPGAETSASRPQAARLQHPQLDIVYETVLDADYDAETHRIDGTMRLTWRNTTSTPVPDLCFHHYLNAFSSNRSTFFQESGGQLRGDQFEGEQWGWIEVDSLRLADGTDVAPEGSYVRPDDGNPFDRTVALYPLPRPIPPGGEISVDVDFTSQLPSIFARTGANGNYVLAGQWFPKIGVFEDGDWNCHQFHAHSEFYADFGNYDVTLTLPSEYAGKIGATGVLVSEETADGQVTARFVQEGVHDFAWTADPDYLVLRDRFDPEADVPAEQRRRIAQTLGLPESELELSPVEITLFLQPAHANQAERYFRSTKEAIRGYGLRLGAYPWGTLTLVDPAHGAGGSGGMEYPTFITLGTAPLLSIPPFHEAFFPEIVTIHEFGHQFFQGMIANNEFEESWIDEGINSYYEMVVMEEEYRDSIRLLGMRLPAFEQQRAAVAGGNFTDPIVTPSWGFLTSGSYGVNSYPRTAVSMRHLENLLGPETFARAMRDFFQRWQFRHPDTRDFQRSIEESTGRDLGWFFDQAWHSTRKLDYAVRSVESEEIDDDRGTFWENGERVERDPDEDGESTDEEDADDGEDDEIYRSVVVVARNGEFVHPVTVEMRFEDDHVIRRTWDGDTRWARWTFTGPRKLEYAVVDPDRKLSLDANRINDSRRVEPEKLPKQKLLTDILFWLQTLFGAGSLVS